jgi:hypothetical protein
MGERKKEKEKHHGDTENTEKAGGGTTDECRWQMSACNQLYLCCEFIGGSWDRIFPPCLRGVSNSLLSAFSFFLLTLTIDVR